MPKSFGQILYEIREQAGQQVYGNSPIPWVLIGSNAQAVWDQAIPFKADFLACKDYQEYLIVWDKVYGGNTSSIPLSVQDAQYWETQFNLLQALFPISMGITAQTAPGPLTGSGPSGSSNVSMTATYKLKHANRKFTIQGISNMSSGEKVTIKFLDNGDTVEISRADLDTEAVVV